MSLTPFLHNQLHNNYDLSKSPFKSLVSRVKSSTSTNAALPIIKDLDIKKEHVKNGKVEDFDEVVMSSQDSATSVLTETLHLETERELNAFLQELEKEYGDSTFPFFKMAANIIGDSLITGPKGIDGAASASKSFQLWKILLNDLMRSLENHSGDELKVLKNLVSGIDQIIEHAKDVENLTPNFDPKNLHNVALKYANFLHNLKPGESRAFWGGYLETGSTKAGGHSLIYEITRLENNNFNVLVYTSTGLGGIRSFPVGHKNKQESTAFFSNVPESVLLFNEDGKVRPGFMQSIIEPLVLGQVDANLKIDIDSVHRILFPLRRYQVPLDIKVRGLITGQIGGTCTDSVMKVFLRNQSGNLGLYKQVIHRIKLKVLILSFNKLKAEMKDPNSNIPYIARQMVLRSARNLFRTTKKMLKGSHGLGQILSADAAKQTMATAREVILEVKKIEKNLKDKDALKSENCNLNDLDFKTQREKRKKEVFFLTHPSVSNSLTKHETVEAPRKIEAATFVETFKKFNERISRIHENYHSAPNKNEVTSFEIHRFILEIPIPKLSKEEPFWNNFSRNDLIELQEQLYKCALFVREFYPNESFPLHVLTLTTLQFLSHYIATKLEAGKLKSANLANYDLQTFYNDVLSSPNILYFEKKEFQRFNELRSYYNAFTAGRYGLRYLFINENETASIEKREITTSSNGEYWHALLDHDFDLQKKAIEAAEKKWKNIDLNAWVKAYEEALILKNDYPGNRELFLKKEQEWKKQGINISNVYNYGNTLDLINPHELKNLPLDTKLTMLMEETGYDGLNEFMSKSGLRHISIYRFITSVARQSSQFGKASSLYRRVFRNSDRNLRVGVSKGEGENKQNIVRQELEKLHRPIDKQLSDQFIPSSMIHPYRFVSRDEYQWNRETSEGATFDIENDSLVRRLERTLAEWELSPNQILYEISKELNALKNPSLQALVIKVFFRSPQLSTDLELGAGNLILSNQAFFENAHTFINKTLLTVESYPDGISIARFLFELSLYLCKYCADAGDYQKAEKFNQINALNRWIGSDKITDSEKSFLHHYIVAFYSTKQELKNEDYKHLLASWSTFKLSNDLNSALLSQTIYGFGRKFILSQSPTLAEKLKDESFRSELGEHILSANGIRKLDPQSKWEFHKIGFPFIQSGEWIINLISGTIYKKEAELVSIPKELPWTLNAHFRRLFPVTNFQYRQIGKDTTIFSEGNANYKIIHSKAIYDEDYSIYIQKEFRCYDKWLEYKGAHDSLPESLKYDSAFWSSGVFKAGKYEIKGVITNKVDKQISHVYLADGRIIEADPVTGLPKEKGRVLESLHLSSTDAIASFDDPKNIVSCRNQETDRLEQISFRRFKSVNGNTLSFIEENSQLVWSEYRNFVLPASMPKSFFQYLNNYLYLKSTKDNKGMILIPGTLGPVKGYTPKISISVENTPVLPIKNSHEFNGNQIYFSYEENNGEIKPTSTESRLYLAYVQLLQRNYEEAVLLLKDNKSTENFSDLSIEILKRIVNHPLEENFPNSHQVILHALYLILEQDSKKSKDGVLKNSELAKKGYESFEKTYNSRNNISHECSLSTEEELTLLEFFSENIKNLVKEHPRVKEDISNRKEFLQNRENSKPPESPLPVETSSAINIELMPYDFKLSEYGLHTNERINEYKDAFKNRAELFYPYSFPFIFSREGSSKIVPKKLFFDVYRIAKNGSSSEKEEMIQKILAWKSYPFPEENYYDPKESIKPYLDLCLSVLCKPENYPALPTDFERKEDIIGFTYKVGEVYSKDKIVAINPKKPEQIPQEFAGASQYPYKFNDDALQSQKSLEEIHNETLPLNVSLDPQNARWSSLSRWKNSWLKGTPKLDKASNKDFKFVYRKDLLKQKEKIYKKSLKKDLEQFQKDYEAGEAQNLDSIQYDIQTHDCAQLLDEAENQLSKVLREQKEKELKILSLANRQSANEVERLGSVGSIQGKKSALLTIQDCIDALLTYDGRTYQLKNENLSDPILVKRIADLTLEYLDLKSNAAQLQRIIKDAKSILDIDRGTQQDELAPTRRYLCQTLYTQLDGTYNFDDFSLEDQTILRVFAGQSGILPYKKQTELIKKMMTLSESDPTRFKDIVIQLIMGGGKTSVIATILLYMAARRKGRLALFIVPSSLLETVASNLSISLKKSFNKNLESLDLERDDFTLFRLQETHKLLKKCLNNDTPIILSDKTIQGFELEMLSLARKIKSSLFEINDLQKEDSSASALSKEIIQERIDQIKNKMNDQIKKARELAQMLVLIGKHGDTLIDEVDIILDSLQELNFIDGAKIHVESELNQLLMTIFKGLISKKIFVDTSSGKISVLEYLKLHTNQQTLINPADYLERVTPVVARYLAEKFKPISQHLGIAGDKHLSSLQQSFIRYASDQMPSALQIIVDQNLSLERSVFEKFPELENYATIHEDIHFLKHLKNLGDGAKPQVLAAKLISMSKHFLTELINLTITKSGGRNYGPSPDPRSQGKIVPYAGLYTPTTREFGYHWEAGAYHYQFGVSNKPQTEQILMMAEKYRASATYYVTTYGEAFEETAEYIEFYQKYGVKLDKIQNPGAIEQIIKYISSDYKKLLEFQFDLVALYATYSSEMLTSNGFSLCRLLASIRSMSGTPWNVEGYIKKLTDNYINDLGTVGRILHALIQKNKQGLIFPIDFEENNLEKAHSIKDFLNQLHAVYPNFKKIRGVIEPGGLFKLYGANEKIAREWMEFIQEKQLLEKDLPEDKKTVDPQIDSVIFFNKDPGQTQPNVVYVWIKGAETPERLGTSSFDELSRKGLLPKNYVVYIDEKHAAGSDFLHIPDAIKPMTWDEKMLLKIASQGIMRLRQFLFEQNTIIIVSKESQKAFYNQGKTQEDLLLHAAKQESVQKAQAMVQMLTQQIQGLADGESRFAILKAILANEFNMDFANLVQANEKFFVRTMFEDPIKQHSRLETLEDTKTLLTGLLESTENSFNNTVKDEALRENVAKGVPVLKEQIRNATSLPTKTRNITNRSGMQQEVQQQIDIESENQKQIEIEAEIELEIQRYQYKGNENVRKEYPMKEEQFFALIDSLKAQTPNNKLTISLQEQIKSYDTKQSTRNPYETLFEQRIYGTYAYFHTTESNSVMSIFDTKHRPAKQLLVTRNAEGRLVWLCLSEFEAQEVFDHLKRLAATTPERIKDIWLVQPDGTLLIENNARTFSLDDPQVMAGLIEINALVGNIDFIDNPKYSGDIEPWLMKHTDLKIRFLKLKSLRNETQRHRLANCGIIVRVLSKSSASSLSSKHYICKLRAQREQNRQGRFIPDQTWKTKILTAEEIRDLNADYVPFLGIDWKKRNSDPDTKQALDSLKRTKGITTEEELKVAAEELSRRQLSHIHVFHGPSIAPHQIRWLPVHKVGLLKNPEQIKSVEGSTVKYLLSEEQVKGLENHQGNLIPHINPDYYPLLDQSLLIQKVPNEHIRKVNSNYFYMLSDSQLKYALTQDEDFLRHLFKHLSPDQIKKLDLNYLNLIPHDKYKYISEEQVKAITDPMVITKLEEIAEKGADVKKGTWSSWIASEMVKHIKTDQVQYLKTPAQFDEMPDDLVQFVNVSQVEHLSVKRLFKLKEIKSQNWKPFLDKITDAQRKAMGSEEKHQLYGEQFYEVMNVEDVKYLTTKEMVQKCRNELVRYLATAQIAFIEKEQVPYLVDTQLLDCPNELIHHVVPSQYIDMGRDVLRKFSDAELKKLIESKEFERYLFRIPPEKIYLVGNAAVLEKIDNENIKSFGVAGFNNLSDKHPLWGRITPEIVKGITANKVKNIPRKMLKYIETREALESVSFFKVVHLKKEQIATLKDRSFGLTYFLGVLTLGVAMSVISLFGYLFIPCTMCSERKSHTYRKWLNRNFKRVRHLFSTYLAA